MFVAESASSGKRPLLLPRKMLLDYAQELFPRRYARHVRAKESRAVFALGIVASELPHQECALLFAESAADQLIVPQHARLLLFQRRLRRNRLPAQRGRGLLKEPRTAQCCPRNHHAIDVV